MTKTDWLKVLVVLRTVSRVFIPLLFVNRKMSFVILDATTQLMFIYTMYNVFDFIFMHYT